MKFFTVAVFLSAIFLSGCKPNSDLPCRAPNYNYITLTNQQSFYPFIGKGDTARYINTSGDSIWCLGTQAITIYKCTPVKNNPECADDSLAYSIYDFLYADTLSKFIFTATISLFDTSYKVIANNSTFNIPLGRIAYNDSLTWFDSLRFGNKMFYNLQSFKNSSGDSLYYNREYGIIGLKQAAQRFYIYRFRNY